MAAPVEETNPFVGGGGFNANGFGMMGGMANMMPIQNNIMKMTVQESVAPPQWPAMDYSNRPPSPQYSFSKPPSRPTSPDYNPTKPASPPLSPAYDPFAPDPDIPEWHPN